MNLYKTVLTHIFQSFLKYPENLQTSDVFNRHSIIFGYYQKNNEYVFNIFNFW